MNIPAASPLQHIVAENQAATPARQQEFSVYGSTDACTPDTHFASVQVRNIICNGAGSVILAGSGTALCNTNGRHRIDASSPPTSANVSSALAAVIHCPHTD